MTLVEQAEAYRLGYERGLREGRLEELSSTISAVTNAMRQMGGFVHPDTAKLCELIERALQRCIDATSR